MQHSKYYFYVTPQFLSAFKNRDESGVLQATFLWAYATLEERMGGACLEALAAQALKQLPHFEAQHMAMMLWAFAKLEHNPGAALLRGCEAHAVRICETFTPQGVVRCFERNLISNVFVQDPLLPVYRLRAVCFTARCLIHREKTSLSTPGVSF